MPLESMFGDVILWAFRLSADRFRIHCDKTERRQFVCCQISSHLGSGRYRDLGESADTRDEAAS
jgi:hypothetical protein